ncbi:amidase [Microlunatus soli]|uniref:Amidase n=1 Tax=Microlunatus soli TaxID=630515 RepID=A0A1H1PUS1_9ACTN|nr:amidase [Microlunatus soli]SDS14930.1 amidase [Microlunatus soli]
MPDLEPAADGDAERPQDLGDLVHLEARQLSALIRDRRISCVEVMESYLEHIDRHNPRVNAIVSIRPRDELLAEAGERDRQLRDGDRRGWMHGFPHAVKDLAAARGIRHTAGSVIHRDRVADTDDLFVQRIRAAGAIIIGKTNTPEFGLGSQTYNPVFGTTATPYDTDRTAGGSSGGAAAAVALRMLPVADGSDYMGSLRNPAAFCNVYGLRPSIGRVPNRAGFVAQLSAIGPMARSVTDLALLLSTQAGPDPYTPLGPHTPLGLDSDPARSAGRLDRDFRGTKIAYVGDWDGYLAFEPGVLEVVETALGEFEALGARVDRVLPAFDPARLFQLFLRWRWWAQTGNAELYDDPATRDLLKPELRWEIEHGLRLTARDITEAVAERQAWYAAVVDLQRNYDYIIAPSAQVFPFDKTVHWPTMIDGRPMDTYHRWMETVAPWSLSGCPVAGVPAGFGDSGLPTGIQIVGRAGQDLAVLQLAHAYHRRTRWPQRRPPPGLAG